MTFTYDLATDVGLVRLRVGDRTQLTSTGVPATEEGIRSDEEIQSFIDTDGSWQDACIAWVQSFLNQLNTEPDSVADWLKIDIGSARESYEKMLGELQTWLGVSGAGGTTTTTPSWRADSNQTEAPESWE